MIENRRLCYDPGRKNILESLRRCDRPDMEFAPRSTFQIQHFYDCGRSIARRTPVAGLGMVIGGGRVKNVQIVQGG